MEKDAFVLASQSQTLIALPLPIDHNLVCTGDAKHWKIVLPLSARFYDFLKALFDIINSISYWNKWYLNDLESAPLNEWFWKCKHINVYFFVQICAYM